MSFDSDIRMFTMKLDAVDKDLVPRVGTAVYDSIVFGSPITGAPGQPVGQYGPGYNPGQVGGTLRGSWQLLFPSPDIAEIVTKLVYAPNIEDAIGKYGPIRLRSSVGGFHGVALTRQNFDRLVTAVVGGRVEGFTDNNALGTALA